jgi:hypothetical protein
MLGLGSFTAIVASTSPALKGTSELLDAVMRRLLAPRSAAGT